VGYYRYFIQWLGQRNTLWIVLLINVVGTIYGYIWYERQMAMTPKFLWPFVPDSPTASLFFCFVLAAFLLHKKWPIVEAFAAVTLFKYGIWASIMIIWAGVLGSDLNWQHYMLLFSHLGMAIQGVLYSSYLSFRWTHLAVVSVWALTNDVLDYTLNIFPWLDRRLYDYLDIVYSVTVSLSLLSLTIFYILVVRRSIKTN
jgi:uncharacterized membrane protein YpjA